MIPIIVLKIQYQVIYNQSNLSFQTYFEEFICKLDSKYCNVSVSYKIHKFEHVRKPD